MSRVAQRSRCERLILNRFAKPAGAARVNRRVQQYLMRQISRKPGPRASEAGKTEIEMKLDAFILRCNVLINSFTKSYIWTRIVIGIMITEAHRRPHFHRWLFDPRTYIRSSALSLKASSARIRSVYLQEPSKDGIKKHASARDCSIERGKFREQGTRNATTFRENNRTETLRSWELFQLKYFNAIDIEFHTTIIEGQIQLTSIISTSHKYKWAPLETSENDVKFNQIQQ